MERIQVLKGEKISLVVLEREDAKIWYKGINNIETQSLNGQAGNIYHMETEYEHYDNERKNQSQKSFSIMLCKSEKIIGNVSLMNISEKNRNAVIGINLFDKEEQNKGYGTEVAKLILQYGFEVLGFHKIKLKVLENNKRAIAVYKKCGFTENGRDKEEIFQGGHYIDSVSMEIMRKEQKRACLKLSIRNY